MDAVLASLLWRSPSDCSAFSSAGQPELAALPVLLSARKERTAPTSIGQSQPISTLLPGQSRKLPSLPFPMTHLNLPSATYAASRHRTLLSALFFLPEAINVRQATLRSAAPSVHSLTPHLTQALDCFDTQNSFHFLIPQTTPDLPSFPVILYRPFSPTPPHDDTQTHNSNPIATTPATTPTNPNGPTKWVPTSTNPRTPNKRRLM
jgi:hypothetical protein